MSNSNSTQYFDLHITGLGYVNRIRFVTPKRGQPFWACDIAALNGPANDVEYRRFDCRVNGHVAEKLVKRFSVTIADRQERGLNEPKILIGFKLGDIYADLFTRKKGPNEGEPSVALKARLLFIKWVKIDGETVYEAPAETKTNDDAIDSGNSHSQAMPQQDAPGEYRSPRMTGSASAGESVGA